MPSEDLFAAEEGVISAAEELIANGSFADREDRQRFAELLKNYQKLFRTTRRLMRLSDRNEQQLNAMGREQRHANEIIAQKNKELEALSKKLSKYLSPQIYHSIFTGAQNVEIASNRKKLTIFFSDVVNFTETTDKLESEDLISLLNRYLTEMSNIALEHGATIGKYIGDAIMVFFGDPETKGVKEDARACVRMGHRHAAALARAAGRMTGAWRRGAVPSPRRHQHGLRHRRQFRQRGSHGLHDHRQLGEFDSAPPVTLRSRRDPYGSRDLFAGKRERRRIMAPAMLSRKIDSPNTNASSTIAPSQPSGNLEGIASGRLLCSNWLARTAKPSKRRSKFANITHSLARSVVTSCASAPMPAGALSTRTKIVRMSPATATARARR
jgi:Adenylate and Guanylate cyclase catalytic domain